ncbi:hypothetical protein WA158_003057 [Blastocystis sp. Blastoise]
MLTTRATLRITRNFARFFVNSPWESVVIPTPDPIFRVQERLAKDTNPNKVGLGIGAYRDGEGKPYVFQSVREAEKRLCCKKDHEYPPLNGVPEFLTAASKFAFGEDCVPLKENRIALCQGISGSGSLKLFGQFFGESQCIKKLYFPNPTWDTHFAFFEKSGCKTDRYTYLMPDRVTLNFDAIMSSIRTAPEGSGFFFHACAHNPSGVDPTHEQWDSISQACKQYKRPVLFDAAYLGFASGDVANDAYAIRKFIKDGHNIALTLSFSKNFGLYGERAGMSAVVCANEQEKQACLAQLKSATRSLWSLPPIYGARIVTEILNDPKLYHQWEKECKEVSKRIRDMRYLLVDNLKKCGSTKDWSHITRQIGMFSFTGLTPEQVEALATQYSVYMVPTGRASLSGINTHNVEYIAKAIHEVTK